MAIKELLDGVSKLQELEKRIKNVELASTIVDLEENILVLRKELISLEKENISLKEEIYKKESIVLTEGNGIHKGKHYLLKDDGSKVGPCCPNCWNNRNKIVNLSNIGSIRMGYHCPECQYHCK